MHLQRKKDNLLKRLDKFDSRSQVISRFNRFKTREHFGCPPRLVANTYSGCGYRCIYCYAQWIQNFFRPRPKSGFLKKLEHDLELISQYQLGKLPVSVANSTEPLQPLEKKYAHTQKLLEKLAARDSRCIIITKNPSPLLTESYLKYLDPAGVYIQVSIPFVYNRESSLEPGAPLPQERLKAVESLVQKGFQVAVRIDPLIPNIPGIKGQSEEELCHLVRMVSQAGVNKIVSKSLRLVGATNAEFPDFYQRLKPYFQKNGQWQNNCYELYQETKTKLMLPVYEACQQEGLQLSTCYEHHDALPEVSGCDQAGPIFVNAGEGTNRGDIDAR